MDGMSLYQELEAKTRMMDRAVSELRARGTALSQAERDYRVALAKRMLELRDEGMPVTIIGDVCRGDEDISLLRLKRDAARVMYDSAREYIMTTKLEVKLIDNQIQRELGRAGMS